MSSTALPVDDAVLKDRHRALWALGDYPRVAAEVIPTLGPVLVEAAGVGTHAARLGDARHPTPGGLVVHEDVRAAPVRRGSCTR